ncbi:MADS-box transcription factor [Pholiota molesta]|nr:MADS-box transcription factor [Pholiota molesta]
MGRRKIEIQPITHERNRSVTFLKRKNGLFKKAYELGVLCSVDVAVIIFVLTLRLVLFLSSSEERPGHHVKLYQYGSSDIHEIVERHIRHDGEKDTRGPSDFSGNTASKLDDIGGEDDEDVDEDEDAPSRSKRRHDGKLKHAPDMVTGGMDYGNHRSVAIPQPPPLSLHGISGQSSGASSLLVSNERGMPRDPKRTHRPGLHLHSRSPSDNPSDPNSGPYAYQGGGGQGAGPFGSRGGAQYAPHHAHHGQQHHHGSGQYQPFFPVSAHQSPPPSFIPLQSDFPRASASSRGGPGAGGGGAGFGIPARTASSSSYDAPGIRGRRAAGRAGRGRRGDPFAAFLDADEQSRHHHHQGQAPQGPGFVGLDWPVHGSGGGAAAALSGPSSSVSNPSAAGSSAGPDAAGNNSNNGNWLDFLSGNNPNAPAPPPPSGARDASMSWERGGPRLVQITAEVGGYRGYVWGRGG